MNNINNMDFSENLVLMFLYNKSSCSTLELENILGNPNESQTINNIISNRFNKTSIINKGLLEYNETNKTISITAKGKNFIERQYPNSNRVE